MGRSTWLYGPCGKNFGTTNFKACKVLGTNSGMLVYSTKRTYNPKVESRVALDDPV
ncbi:MAG: hypothetical protein ABSG32_03680 [Terriglobia bacterium]